MRLQETTGGKAPDAHLPTGFADISAGNVAAIAFMAMAMALFAFDDMLLRAAAP